MARNRYAFGYMEPHHDIADYAQCSSCKLWIKNRKRCYWLSDKKEVDGGDSCILYVQGKYLTGEMTYPINALTPSEVGFYEGKVRCENCVSYNKAENGCDLFYKLNEEFPDIFKLDTKVKARGCCNAFEGKK